MVNFCFVSFCFLFVFLSKEWARKICLHLWLFARLCVLHTRIHTGLIHYRIWHRVWNSHWTVKKVNVAILFMLFCYKFLFIIAMAVIGWHCECCTLLFVALSCSVSLFLCLSVCLSAIKIQMQYQRTLLFIIMTICLLPVCLSLSVSLTLCLSLFVCLSLCQKQHEIRHDEVCEVSFLEKLLFT